MKINIYTPYFSEIKKVVKKTAKYVIKKESMKKDINIIFVNKVELRKMKKEFLKQNLFTDVMSFELDEVNEVYLSPEVIHENSIERSVNYVEELVRVVIHGILHLKGLTDQELWEDQEKYVKEVLNLLKQ